MVHLRIVAPVDRVDAVRELLAGMPSVVNVVHLAGVATKPAGDLFLCDVAREQASVLIGGLRELGIERQGSIAIEAVDASVSDVAVEAERLAPGHPSDAVVWEEIEARVGESTALSGSFLAFMVIATALAAVGIIQDSTVLVIGAMVVGPEFGPLAALAVAVAQRRGRLARRSLAALTVGFGAALVVTLALTLLARAIGLLPDRVAAERPLTGFIAEPSALSLVVACLAGTAGVLSLTTAKSGPLIGVLISVTTIPAAGDTAVALVYGHQSEALRALAQLALNVAGIAVSGIAVLLVQQRLAPRP